MKRLWLQVTLVLVSTSSFGSAYQNRHLPVGLFDSGVGGFTILEALLSLDKHNNTTHQFVNAGDGIPDFDAESFQYLADRAFMPYGQLGAESRPFSLQTVVQNAHRFLQSRDYIAGLAPPTATGPYRWLQKEPTKLQIVACNSASLALTAGLQRTVVSVVEAGAEAIAQKFHLETSPFTIAIIATQSTIDSGGYPQAIKRQLAAKNADAKLAHFLEIPAPGLAKAIEASDSRRVQELVQKTIAQMKQPLLRADSPALGAIVLGCTHYPLVANEIAEAANSILGGQLHSNLLLINPAEQTAISAYRLLTAKKLHGPARNSPSTLTFFQSEGPVYANKTPVVAYRQLACPELLKPPFASALGPRTKKSLKGLLMRD